MKKQTILLTLGMLLSSSVYSQHQDDLKIKLTSDIINLLDGTMFGITPERIGIILLQRKSVREMLYGQVVKGHYVGLYDFNGTKHNVISLTKYEAECNARYTTARENFMNGTISADEWHQCCMNYQQETAKLRNMLVHVKEEFKRVTKPYVESARGFKAQMLALIAESCEKRNKASCFLLKWSEAREGQETEALDNEIQTFEALKTFFSDLTHFLEDLVNSCDKAREQFIAKVRSQKK